MRKIALGSLEIDFRETLEDWDVPSFLRPDIVKRMIEPTADTDIQLVVVGVLAWITLFQWKSGKTPKSLGLLKDYLDIHSHERQAIVSARSQEEASKVCEKIIRDAKRMLDKEEKKKNGRCVESQLDLFSL